MYLKDMWKNRKAGTCRKDRRETSEIQQLTSKQKELTMFIQMEGAKNLTMELVLDMGCIGVAGIYGMPPSRCFN